MSLDLVGPLLPDARLWERVRVGDREGEHKREAEHEHERDWMVLSSLERLLSRDVTKERFLVAAKRMLQSGYIRCEESVSEYLLYQRGVMPDLPLDMDILRLSTTYRFDLEFALLGRLGTGGFGKVFLCRKHFDGADYAVKQIHLRGKASAIKRMEVELSREFRTLSRMNHPNILRYYDAWLEPGWRRRDSSPKILPLLSETAGCASSFPSTVEGLDSSSTSPSESSSLSSSSSNASEEERSQTADFCEDSGLLGTADVLLSLFNESKRHGSLSASSEGEASSSQVPPDYWDYEGSPMECPSTNRSGSDVEGDGESASSRSRRSRSPDSEGEEEDDEDPIPPLGLLESVRKVGSSWLSSSSSSSLPFSAALSPPSSHGAEACPPLLSPSASTGSLVLYRGASAPCSAPSLSSPHLLPRGAPAPKIQYTLFIQMEYCSGGTLKAWLERRARSNGSVDAPLCLSLASQLLAGLGHIHSQQVIHRDIKPENVFFTDESTVKIGDFDPRSPDSQTTPSPVDSLTPPTPLFQDLTSPSVATQSSVGSVVSAESSELTSGIGTPTYASPEQLESHEYGPSTDVFSLGLIFLELFHVFTTNSERYTVFKRLRSDPTQLPPTLTQSSPQIAGLISQMLDPNPLHRPDVSELSASGVFSFSSSLKDNIIEMQRRRIQELELMIKRRASDAE